MYMFYIHVYIEFTRDFYEPKGLDVFNPQALNRGNPAFWTLHFIFSLRSWLLEIPQGFTNEK